MVALAEMKAVGGRVPEVAEADAHVAADRAGNRDGDGDSEDGMHQAQGVEVAVAKEDHAGRESPDERDNGEERVGKVSDGEESAGCGNRAALSGENAKQPEEDETLQ